MTETGATEPGSFLPRLVQLGNTISRGHLYGRVVQAAGITLERPALTVLLVLLTTGRPTRIGEIAARMEVEGPHVTRHVQGLEKRGLVERVVDPDDRRARLIELSATGRELAERYTSVISGWFDQALSGWSDKDKTDLDRLVVRMLDDLQAVIAAFAETP